MAHQNEVPSFGGFRGSRPEDITQWVKLVGAGSSKCHGSNIHGNTPSNQCASSVLVSFTADCVLYPTQKLIDLASNELISTARASHP